METINDRFKALRKKLSKSQEEMGKILGLTKSGISDIENGRRNVTEQHLIMLANYKEKPININWLRTGEGNMFKERLLVDEVGEYVEELLEYNPNNAEEKNPFYDMIIEMMRTYHDMDDKSQSVMRDYFGKLQDGIKKEKD